MIRNVLSALFALIIALGFAGCGGGDSQEVVDISMHDNWVYLEPYPPFYPTMAYEEADHSITSGQPWGGVVTGVQDQNWGIDARAGRHKSSSVAEWFRSHASVATCTMDCTSTWPSELNFAFTGTITINGTAYPITIGQGSTALGTNNWWIGGPGWTMPTNHNIFDAIATPDGKYFIEPDQDSSDVFWVMNELS